MYKKFLLLALLLIHEPLCSFEWRVENRISLAPAWQSFYSYTEFELSPQAFVPIQSQAEEVKTGLIMMPYFEGRSRVYLGEHINFQIAAGGGFFHNKSLNIIDYLFFVVTPTDIASTSFVLPARTDNNLVTVDVQGGSQWCCGCAWMSLNPLVGYVYNQQKFFSSFLDIPGTMNINTKWSGPYVGIEGALYPTDRVTLRGLYKCVLGRVHSLIGVVEPPFFLVNLNSDAGCSSYRAPVLGNIVTGEFRYDLHRHA